MRQPPNPAQAVAFVWTGLLIGGSFIAAPAKFQVASLPLATALEIGRVTFRWIGFAEIALAVALVSLAVALRCSRGWLTLVPVALLAVQRLAILPPLDRRTLDMIEGASVGESHLHIVFIAVEVLKLAVLVWIALRLERGAPEKRLRHGY